MKLKMFNPQKWTYIFFFQRFVSLYFCYFTVSLVAAISGILTKVKALCILGEFVTCFWKAACEFLFCLMSEGKSNWLVSGKLTKYLWTNNETSFPQHVFVASDVFSIFCIATANNFVGIIVTVCCFSSSCWCCRCSCCSCTLLC